MVVAKLERANSRPITYERGLIPAFKAVISYWMLYWLLISPVVLIFTGNPGVLARWQYASLIGIQAIALGLLFWRAGKYYLKQVYLPLILTITSLSFLVEKVWFLSLGTLPGASRGELLHAFAVRQDFALLLLIIAWQYKFRHAVFYVACISVTEWYLVFRADLPDHLGSTLNTNMLLSRAIVYLLLAYIITGLMQQQRQQQRELAQVNQQLKQHASMLEQLTVSRERNRLARELHDTLAHSLSALSVQLEATRSLWELDQAAAKAMLDNADKTTREGLEEARRALQALRASPLESLGFIEAIRELAEHAAQRADLKLQLDLPETLVLSQAAEQGIYRITQEALENVVRHAGASQLTLKLSASDKSLVLRIEDNGVGFDLEAIGSRCLGVKGMQERAVLLGAHLKVDSLKARGTTLTLGLEV